MPPAAAARRASQVPAPFGAGAGLLAVLVCLLHAVCGGGTGWQPSGTVLAAPASPAGAAVAAVAAFTSGAEDGVPDAGPHQHPAPLARRGSVPIGSQHRGVPPFGHASSPSPRPHPARAAQPGAPSRVDPAPAGSTLPYTVLRC